jgi:hypothetical protein
MAAVRILAGDFIADEVRIRYSRAGRAFLRVASVDGIIEDLYLKTNIIDVIEPDAGHVSTVILRQLAEAGLGEHPVLRRNGREERLFLVLLKDGRRLVARASTAMISELRDLARGGTPVSPPLIAEASRIGMFARLLPARLRTAHIDHT